MKALSEKELVRILNANGYKLIRQSGHQIFSNGKINVAVPRSRKNLLEFLWRVLHDSQT